jgi:two-component system sensor histidine kinase UhpB
MDLRRQLMGKLALYLLVLSVAIAGLWWLVLQRDATDEQAAALRLAELISIASKHGTSKDGQAEAVQQVQQRLQEGGLRHVQATLEPITLLQRVSFSAEVAQRYPLGDFNLVIQPMAGSEMAEKLRDSGSFFLVLLLFASVSLFTVWYLVGRALSPVKVLETALSNLHGGHSGDSEAIVLPRFALREFDRIAQAVQHLSQRLAQARTEQQRLTRCLIEVEESERSELARELHDEFGQALVAISVSAAFIERNADLVPLQQLQQCAKDIGKETRTVTSHVRNLLTRLRPHGLESLGLIGALHDLLDGWRPRSAGIVLETDLPSHLHKLSQPVSLALYRMVQEALTNVLRHSAATWCRLSLLQDDQQISLCISDNGKGRVADLAGTLGGGLLGMRERVTLAGGEFCIQDRDGGGLTLLAHMPTFSINKENAP